MKVTDVRAVVINQIETQLKSSSFLGLRFHGRRLQ
jgi:hypothetical protein